MIKPYFNLSTFIEKDTTFAKPYYLISTFNFNLKAFDFLNLIFTQPITYVSSKSVSKFQESKVLSRNKN
jgi:hypothetical protein